MTDIQPLNTLEAAIAEARAGAVAMPQLLETLMGSEVAIPSGSEVAADGSGMQPLLFEGEDGPLLACFSDMGRIGPYAQMAPYCLVTKGANLVRRMPRDLGLVVNPGLDWGFQISAQGLQSLREEAEQEMASADHPRPPTGSG